MAVVIDVGVETSEQAGLVHRARQTVNTTMIIVAAAARVIAATGAIKVLIRRVIRTARRVSQGPEIIVERMVLLHDDDDVHYHAELSISARRSDSKQETRQK